MDNKWTVTKRIKNFRNIKDVEFEFIKGGITIIVGENNIGKTNLLDYIYEENKNWDQFELKESDYETDFFPEINQRLPSYRKNNDIIDLFFSPWDWEQYRDIDTGNNILHHSNRAYKKFEIEGNMELSYKIYYFDLTASTSFLTKEGKEGFNLEKVKSRSCELIYGKEPQFIDQSIDETWEKETDYGDYHDHFFMEVDKEKPEKVNPWSPIYETKEGNFIKHEEGDITTYRGFYEDVCHSLGKLGSGYLKYKTIESLVESIDNRRVVDRGNILRKSHLPTKVQSTILLMDEPEVFLHSSLISNLANLIKKAEEKDITVILTTHSSDFLLNFTDWLVEGEAELVFVTQKRDQIVSSSTKLIYFNTVIHSKIKERIRIDCKEFNRKGEDVNDKNDKDKFDQYYKDKWKRLFNKETLRIFFSKNVLFVEGMYDYILFNNLLREELSQELNNIEIIPIFGKWHYVYFSELAKELNLNYWFLLDNDLCSEKENPDKFWAKYGEGKTKNGGNGILHSFELFVNFEEIIASSTVIKVKQNAVEQISNFLENNKLGDIFFPEEYWNWKEKINKLNTKEEIFEFLKLMEREANLRISWFSCDVETFLFGRRQPDKKEYNMISKFPEFIKNKEENHAKLNELKKVLEFINKKFK